MTDFFDAIICLIYKKRSRNFLLLKTVRLSDISFDWLRELGIQGIALDLDNTLISEDDKYLSPEAEKWIGKARHLGFRMVILSNGKRYWRVKFWSCRLGLPSISPARKPFPFGFRKAGALMQLRANQVVMIGDSLHTDILGAWLYGCWCIQVATLPHKPRWWEILAGRWVQTPYPMRNLLDFDTSQYPKVHDYLNFTKD